MKVTLDHPKSKHGHPVILDAAGKLVPSAPGIRAVLDHVGVKPSVFATYCGMPLRTLESYISGQRRIPANVLIMLGILLETPEDIGNHGLKSDKVLNEAERWVMAGRRDGRTFDQIAELMGCSRQNGYQFYRSAVAKRTKT